MSMVEAYEILLEPVKVKGEAQDTAKINILEGGSRGLVATADLGLVHVDKYQLVNGVHRHMHSFYLLQKTECKFRKKACYRAAQKLHCVLGSSQGSHPFGGSPNLLLSTDNWSPCDAATADRCWKKAALDPKV